MDWLTGWPEESPTGSGTAASLHAASLASLSSIISPSTRLMRQLTKHGLIFAGPAVTPHNPHQHTNNNNYLSAVAVTGDGSSFSLGGGDGSGSGVGGGVSAQTQDGAGSFTPLARKAYSGANSPFGECCCELSIGQCAVCSPDCCLFVPRLSIVRCACLRALLRLYS